jgi:hypothetical protein
MLCVAFGEAELPALAFAVVARSEGVPPSCTAGILPAFFAVVAVVSLA